MLHFLTRNSNLELHLFPAGHNCQKYIFHPNGAWTWTRQKLTYLEIGEVKTEIILMADVTRKIIFHLKMHFYHRVQTELG